MMLITSHCCLDSMCPTSRLGGLSRPCTPIRSQFTRKSSVILGAKTISRLRPPCCQCLRIQRTVMLVTKLGKYSIYSSDELASSLLTVAEENSSGVLQRQVIEHLCAMLWIS